MGYDSVLHQFNQFETKKWLHLCHVYHIVTLFFIYIVMLFLCVSIWTFSCHWFLHCVIYHRFPSVSPAPNYSPVPHCYQPNCNHL